MIRSNGEETCVGSAAGLPCVSNGDCNDLLLVSGNVYTCEKSVCKAVGYAGDSCGAENEAPCVGNSTCNGAQCIWNSSFSSFFPLHLHPPSLKRCSSWN